MKGLAWFKVVSDIAMDDDLEHVSDAAFRTFIELIGLCVFHLNDGQICRRVAQKQCNTRRVASALQELSASGHIHLDDEFITIVNFAKYQETKAIVQSHREREKLRVRAYRERTYEPSNDAKSKSKSIEKEKERETTSPSGNGKVDGIAIIRGRFDHWRVVFPAETAQMTLTEDRKRAIGARLREGISPETIDLAVTNAQADPWWNGSKDGEWKADIKTICGQGSTVEKLAIKARTVSRNAHIPDITPEFFDNFFDK